ncbi:HEAT repeat domain-containing protein [Stutzerimonas stutzeri]|uniref:HEAT repeat domain-containing protein n=1 Tax=Stutzerimonas stutzeri TaxID=316 RepID=UPI0037125668
MRTVEIIIQDLESSNSSIRNKAALDLMDMQAEGAVEPLLKAISKPENVNHRGTLVYALTAFNCEQYLEVIVDLALTGNYEVAAEACSIISELKSSPENVNRLQKQLLKYDAKKIITEHNHAAHQELLEFVASESESAR